MQPINEVSELFRHQRAVRAFSDREVDAATVEQLLTAATHGPSGSNSQPWRFIVVRDAEVKAQLSEVYEAAFAEAYAGRAPARASDRQPWTAVPVLIVACVQVPSTGRSGIQTGASIYPACQNLMLTARSMGLGSVLTTLHRVKRQQIHEILGIPEGWDTAAILPIGWPDRAYGPNRRPPVSEVTMYDRWSE
ncbi:MAG: nitroreductase family protein [Chloroflexi bacterium]|nr:nitroreductase family protein [Chloroflexota bacterium]MDA1147712.1 nitroreductase family protein [Chloroflexota bacterium]